MTPKHDRTDSTYQAPTVRSLGTVEEMTEQGFNKIGNSSDQFSPALVGKIVPVP